MSLHGESLPTPSVRADPQHRIRLNVLFGVPDDSEGVVRATPDGSKLTTDASGPGRRSFTLRGSANIAPFLSPERFVLNRFYLQGDAGTRISIGPGAILNHIADPDICSQALARVTRIAGQARRPCFNHPTAVAQTTRDGVARLLAGIPRLIVPKTIRAEQTSPGAVDRGVRLGPLMVGRITDISALGLDRQCLTLNGLRTERFSEVHDPLGHGAFKQPWTDTVNRGPHSTSICAENKATSRSSSTAGISDARRQDAGFLIASSFS
jgi:hypothetical protein